MLGIIGIEKLKVLTVIGVHAEERTDQQELLIDLKVKTDISSSVENDSIHDALNYEDLKQVCEEVAGGFSFQLIESFAVAILKAVQAKYPLSHIWIRVLKPKALPNANGAFVEIESS